MAETGNSSAKHDAKATPARRPYHAPRLIEYGSVAKLTQTGGFTTKDATSLQRKCL